MKSWRNCWISNSGETIKMLSSKKKKQLKGKKLPLEKGELAGTVMDYTVTEYEEALAGYKKAGKAAKKS